MEKTDKTCTLCHLAFSNDDQFQQHVNGRKHLKLESIKSERDKNARCSIFVSGLKKNELSLSVEEHFIQFGAINKIVMDKDKNAYAIVEFASEESVEAALAFTGDHRVNAHPVKVSRRERKEFIAKTSNKSEAKIEALDKVKEEALLVNKLLIKCDSFDEQVEKLIEYLQLTDEQVNARRAICDNLTEIFKKYWPETDFQVRIFGSTANNLACKGSDIDVTLLLNEYLTLKSKQPEQSCNGEKGASDTSGSDSAMTLEDDDEGESVDTVSETDIFKESVEKFFKDKDYKQLIHLDTESQMKILSNIIQRNSTMAIKSVRTVINTRCPIVRFFHEQAKIYCDLTLNNYLAHENTQLIDVYLHLEPSLRKLIYVLRYWLKQKNIDTLNRFNSYSLIWLIVFYMQQKQLGCCLPTVSELASMTNNVSWIHGWNCTFERDLEKIKASQNHLTTQTPPFSDLLKSFFDFYAMLNLSSSENNASSGAAVLCTRTNTVVAEPSHHSDAACLSKRSLFVNVQDPFDLSHNLTANISKNTFASFLAECRASSELLHYGECPRRSASKCWGLILLMTRKALPLPAAAASSEPLSPSGLVELSKLTLSGGADKLERIPPANQIIEFVIFLLTDCLLFEQSSEDCSEMAIAKSHKRRISGDTTIDDENSLPKRPKMASNGDQYASNLQLEVADESIACQDSSECVVTLSTHRIHAMGNTWQGRRAVKRGLPQRQLSVEKLISQKLSEKEAAGATVDFQFQIKFVLHRKEGVTHLQLKFELLNGTDAPDLANFATLVHFLDVYINNCYGSYFTEWRASMSI